jgi:hypothetical protein
LDLRIPFRTFTPQLKTKVMSIGIFEILVIVVLIFSSTARKEFSKGFKEGMKH